MSIQVRDLQDVLSRLSPDQTIRVAVHGVVILFEGRFEERFESSELPDISADPDGVVVLQFEEEL